MNRGAIAGMLVASVCGAVMGCRPGMMPPADAAPLPSPDVALAHVKGRTADRQSLRASGRVTYFGEQGRLRVRTIVLAQRPGAFRVETLSPLEQPIDVMASDGQDLWLLSKGRLLTGEATPEHVARLLPLALPPESVVDILLGGIPASAGWQATDIAWEEGQWKVAVEGRTGQRGHLWVDPERGVTTEFVVREPSGAEQVRVKFGDFDEAVGAAGPFPRRIWVVLTSPKADVKIKLDTPELGIQLDGGLFRIDPPPGVHAEPL